MMIKRLDRTEFLIAIAAFVVLFSAFACFKVIRIDEMRGDSAMYLQATENIATRGLPVSQVKASIDRYTDGYLTMPADRYLNDPVVFARPTPVSEKSLLIGHAYFILYPIALLVRAFPVHVVLLLLYVLSFTGMLLLAYVVLRRSGVSIVGSCLCCLLIVSHPAWSEGLLWGQFYPDRLFIVAGFIFMLLASRSERSTSKSKNGLWLLIAAVLCASINERGALVSGAFLLAYVIFSWSERSDARYYRLALAGGLLCYGYALLKLFVAGNAAYGSFFPTGVGGLLQMTQQPRFVPLLTLFALVNAPFLCLAVPYWRGAVIAAGLMLPNILGSIGGAEKTGWSTHYPSFFFPSLVWAALAGYVVLFQMAASRKLLPGLYAVTVGLMVFLWMLNPYSEHLNFAFSNIGNTILPNVKYAVQVYLVDPRARETLAAQANDINRAVPAGAVVSSVEAGMPLLYRDRTVDFFPEGIDNADYAVLGGHYIDGKISYYGVVTSLGPVEREKLNALVVARMQRDGYDLDHPMLFPALNGLAVVRRAR